MQISLKCGACGHQYLSEGKDDLAMEIDFVTGEIRYLCRKCKKENILTLKPRDDKRLPSIGTSRF